MKRPTTYSCRLHTFNDDRSPIAVMDEDPYGKYVAIADYQNLLDTIEEHIQDAAADYQYNLLRRFDPLAADSTDLYTWITCKMQELETAKETIDQLNRVQNGRAT